MGNYGQVSGANSKKKWNEKNPDKVKKSANRAYKKHYAKNKDKINERSRERRKQGATCEIIKQHHKDMKDDPERLTTDFMKRIVDIECDV